MDRVFTSIRSFIERSPLTKRSDTSRGTTFHKTMTYFWSHMVHFARESIANPDGKFKTFLLMNPHLVNGSIFLHYYSKKRMLLEGESRVRILLPDVRPLPALLSSATTMPAHEHLIPREPITDAEFLVGFKTEAGASSIGWNHDLKVRYIYLLILEAGGVLTPEVETKVLDALRAVDKDGFHLTKDHFWVTMVSIDIAKVAKKRGMTTFEEFYRQPECQALRNWSLPAKYFSPAVLDSSAARTELILPNKPLPSST